MKRDDVSRVDTLDELFDDTDSAEWDYVAQPVVVDNDENRKNGDNMSENNSGWQKPDSEEQKRILDSVDVHSKYEEKIIQITLGELICDYSNRVVAERLIGQRGLDYSDEDDADWNKNILMGFQQNKSLHLVEIEELLEGYKDKLLSATNDNMRIFYEERVSICEKHLKNGKDLHLADGQHRLAHIVRVFSPDSTVPIKLKEKREWTRRTTSSISGNSQFEKYDLRGKCMADMPEDVRGRVLMSMVTLEITTTWDDVLVAERFLSDNSGTPALPPAKIGILARSPLKSQLEQIEKEVDFIPLNFKTFNKFANWSAMDFLKDRLYAAVRSPSPWCRNANGFQSFVMNVAFRLFGDDFLNTGFDLQGKIRFADPGFQDGKQVLLHEDAELSEKNYHATVEILQSMAMAHDKLVTPPSSNKQAWEGRTKASNLVNDILFIEILYNGDHFAGKYKVEEIGEILSEFAEWDKQQQKESRYEIGKNGSVKRRKLSNGDYKSIERNEGYYHDSNLNQHQSHLLEYRSEFICDEFCLKRKEYWLANGWLSIVESRKLIINCWENQNGKCAISGKIITEDQLTNGDVRLDYDSNNTERLVLSRLLQDQSLNNFLDI